MKYVALEGTDTRLSRIGFGGEQLGGYRWGKTSEAEMVRAVHQALASGINFFDTAPIYGLGHSEGVLGRALGAHRQDIFLATKVGYVWDNDAALKKTTPASPVEKRADSSPANISREIDMSLKRLRTDYIDLYQIHLPDPNTPLAETLLAIDKLKQAGKIRYIGLCNFSLELLKEARRYAEIKAVQVPYNLIDRKAERDLLPYCRQNNIAVLAYSPLARGFLSGKYDSNAGFGRDDHRSRDDDEYFQGEALLRNLKVLAKVRAVAGKLNRSPAQVALRWVLENPAVTAAIFGAKDTAQVTENVAALESTLSQDDIKFLSGEA